MRRLRGWSGVLLIYVGLLNALFGPWMGTCTQGSANAVLAAAEYAAVCYLIGFSLLWRLHGASEMAWALGPALVGMIYQAAWSALLAYHVLAGGGAVCGFLMSEFEGYPQGPVPVALLWPAVSSIALAGLLWRVNRLRQSAMD